MVLIRSHLFGWLEQGELPGDLSDEEMEELNTPPPEGVDSVGPKGAVSTFTIRQTMREITMHDSLPVPASLAALSFSPDACRYLQVRRPLPNLAIATPGLSAKPQPSDHVRRTWVSTL